MSRRVSSADPADLIIFVEIIFGKGLENQTTHFSPIWVLQIYLFSGYSSFAIFVFLSA